MADFQSIAARIFEKDRVIAGSFVPAWAFDVPSSGSNDDLGQPVNLGIAMSPERDPGLVGDMPRRFSNAEKLRRATGADRFKLQPAIDSDVVYKSQRRQEGLVEGSCLGQTADPQIDVIVNSHSAEL